MKFLTLLISCNVLLQLASPTFGQPEFEHETCYDADGFYSSNSTYQRNLASVLSILDSNNQIDSGFYNISFGDAHALAFCRGDVGLDDCRGCITNSSRKILEICPNQTHSIGVYDSCRLRYNNRSIYGQVEISPAFIRYNTGNVSNVNLFTQAQQSLFTRLRKETASGDSTLKYASGNERFGIENLYALMQCSPDLSSQDCDYCLSQAIMQIGNCCEGKLAARVINPSCDVRYDRFEFFASPPPRASPVPELLPPPDPQIQGSRGKDSNRARTIVIIVVPTVSVVIIFIICFCILLRKHKPWGKAEMENEIDSSESLQLDFGTVKVATNNFTDENKLGQGGFGAVYKGTLYNGQEVAVKRLAKNSGQGDLEFKNEVQLVAKLQHRNLVRLLGFCLEGNERLLIYEFVPNASLDHFLFGMEKLEGGNNNECCRPQFEVWFK